MFWAYHKYWGIFRNSMVTVLRLWIRMTKTARSNWPWQSGPVFSILRVFAKFCPFSFFRWSCKAIGLLLQKNALSCSCAIAPSNYEIRDDSSEGILWLSFIYVRNNCQWILYSIIRFASGIDLSIVPLRNAWHERKTSREPSRKAFHFGQGYNRLSKLEARPEKKLRVRVYFAR